MNIALLFEQSGTFKNILKSTGHNAKDYDISNMFNETDVQCNIFDIIDNFKYDNEIFKSDLIIAFFPCTYFSDFNNLIFNGTWHNFRKMSELEKRKYILERHRTQKAYCCRLEKLINLCNINKTPLIIENPVSTFMTSYIKTHSIDHVKHRRNLYGDILVKPTYYLLFNGAVITQLDTIKKTPKTTIKKLRESNLGRSLIHRDYVENLLRHTYINKTNIFYGNNA